MQRYKMTFDGRRRDAIGVFYNITADREAETKSAAKLALYDEFEHVQNLKFVCVNCGQWQDETSGDCFHECKTRGFAS